MSRIRGTNTSPELRVRRIAYRLGYIDAAQVERLGESMKKNRYGQYLLGLLREPLVR